MVPVSLCEAEQSFSALPRLKTWLQASVAQDRLNNIIVCNVNEERLDKLNMKMICQVFVGSSDTQRNMFSSFSRSVVPVSSCEAENS